MNLSNHHYETTFILNTSREETEIESSISRAVDIITQSGGEIIAINKWGRKRLAYPIKKKNNAFYVNIEFKAPGSVINQLERSYILDEIILRFLTIKLDKKAIQAKQPTPPTTAATEEPPEPVTPIREPLFEDDLDEAEENEE